MILVVVMVVVVVMRKTSSPLLSYPLLLGLPTLKGKVERLRFITVLIISQVLLYNNDNTCYHYIVQDDHKSIAMEGKLKAGHLGDGQCSSLGHFPFWTEESVAFQRLVSEAWSGEMR